MAVLGVRKPLVRWMSSIICMNCNYNRKEVMCMKGIIDRLEGDLVVFEINGETKDFPKAIILEGAEVGAVVEIIATILKGIKN